MTAAKRRASVALLFASIAALPSVARADGTNKSADSLFREGRTLLDAKKYDEACPRLAESQKLEPGAGTLLALALCHQGQGKSASAWAELNEAATLGKKNGRPDLAIAAEKRAHAMEGSLAKLVIRMPPTDGVDYAVSCDGVPVAASDWGVPFPVDPGEHRVQVSATGKLARGYVVRMSGAGAIEIVIDKLDDVAKPAPVPAVVTNTETIRVSAVSRPFFAPVEENRGGTQRAIGLAVAGVGLVGFGAGAYLGGRALSESHTANRTCTTTPCPDSANDANSRAKSFMGASIGSIAAGTGALAIGTVIYLMAPRSNPTRGSVPSSRITARLAPEASPTQLGMGLTGAF